MNIHAYKTPVLMTYLEMELLEFIGPMQTNYAETQIIIKRVEQISF